MWFFDQKLTFFGWKVAVGDVVVFNATKLWVVDAIQNKVLGNRAKAGGEYRFLCFW